MADLTPEQEEVARRHLERLQLDESSSSPALSTDPKPELSALDQMVQENPELEEVFRGLDQNTLTLISSISEAQKARSNQAQSQFDKNFGEDQRPKTRRRMFRIMTGLGDALGGGNNSQVDRDIDESQKDFDKRKQEAQSGIDSTLQDKQMELALEASQEVFETAKDADEAGEMMAQRLEELGIPLPPELQKFASPDAIVVGGEAVRKEGQRVGLRELGSEIITLGEPDDLTFAREVMRGEGKYADMSNDEREDILNQRLGDINDKRDEEKTAAKDKPSSKDVSTRINQWEEKLNDAEASAPRTSSAGPVSLADARDAEEEEDAVDPREALRNAKTIEEADRIGRRLNQEAVDRARSAGGTGDKVETRALRKAAREQVDALFTRVSRVEALVESGDIDKFLEDNGLTRAGLVGDLQGKVDALQRAKSDGSIDEARADAAIIKTLNLISKLGS